MAGGFNPVYSNTLKFSTKRDSQLMTPSSNYSAYFQAQLQVIPQKIDKPAKEKSQVVIRYKRNWTKEH